MPKFRVFRVPEGQAPVVCQCAGVVPPKSRWIGQDGYKIAGEILWTPVGCDRCSRDRIDRFLMLSCEKIHEQEEEPESINDLLRV